MAFTPNVFPTFTRQPRKGLVQIANADASNQKTVVTAGASGSKVTNLVASSTDTSARDIQVSVVRSATTYVLATTTVPITAGFVAGTPPVDLLAAVPNLPRDQDGQPYLFVESGDTLVVNALTTVTTAKVVSVHSDYSDF